ncbi:hypothetical protein B0H11DRAFT_1920606 [Mycena galericulata]|nr:hypothetical protein B0H11DRAFT_1920606 [Mycena galericulata]
MANTTISYAISNDTRFEVVRFERIVPGIGPTSQHLESFPSESNISLKRFQKTTQIYLMKCTRNGAQESQDFELQLTRVNPEFWGHELKIIDMPLRGILKFQISDISTKLPIGPKFQWIESTPELADDPHFDEEIDDKVFMNLKQGGSSEAETANDLRVRRNADPTTSSALFEFQQVFSTMQSGGWQSQTTPLALSLPVTDAIQLNSKSANTPSTEAIIARLAWANGALNS